MDKTIALTQPNAYICNETSPDRGGLIAKREKLSKIEQLWLIHKFECFATLAEVTNGARFGRTPSGSSRGSRFLGIRQFNIDAKPLVGFTAFDPESVTNQPLLSKLILPAM